MDSDLLYDDFQENDRKDFDNVNIFSLTAFGVFWFSHELHEVLSPLLIDFDGLADTKPSYISKIDKFSSTKLNLQITVKKTCLHSGKLWPGRRRGPLR